MLLSLQGSHKPHCLKKKDNIWGCKTYHATLPSHPTPIPPKSNAKFIFKVPSSFFLFCCCDFVSFQNIKSLKQPPPPSPHTHTFVPPKVKCKVHILFYCYPFILFGIKILTQNLYLRLIYLQIYNMIILQFASILLGP